ncbi:protein DWARF 53-LIKE-like [Phoenix dactylifera]|uniref:Protein DWARF 53-LIKE-like n=1 Tax=Phoenix dactylifera TaxID=42345 RepID=A0A8B7CSZ4_PHODC|nr:protein DWARF 53-LIKE-like [Phoenix dactylifera]
MPTPVSSARQCLAAEAAATLDDAVAVARRRAHAQTTSLHVVYALLSSSSSSSSSPGGAASTAVPSILRDALSRARSSAYSPRLQFKALELCFGVALDRLPSSSSHHHQQQAALAEEPPVSNSLMAAIKRSQANQRRNPETFHLYQQQQQQQQGSSSFSGVKVELQQLVLAILDDPVVSRVFGEAGFRSSDIKLAVLRPPPPVLRFPRAARCPPLFLCNFSAADDLDALTPRGFTFPFSSQFCSDDSDGNCRRIGEVLARRSSRNPMLVGVTAGDAARDFARAVERKNWSVLPPELRGLRLVSIEREVSELGKSGDDRSWIGAWLEELGRQAEEPGVVLSIGDLKGMVEGGDDAGKQSSLVLELTRVLELLRGRLWVMGWSATYETYMKFLSRYPLLDKDWDLQLLPITAERPGIGGSLPRPPSLMDSFVPFGGFFPTIYESKGLLSCHYPSALRCQHCNDKCEQDVAAILKGHSASAEDQQLMDVPSWMQRANVFSMNDGLDASKAKDDKTLLNVKIMDLQKKWNDYCQRIHRGCQRFETDSFQMLPNVVGLPCISDKERANNQNSKNHDLNRNQKGYENPFPVVVDLQKIAPASQSLSLPVIPESKNRDLISKLQVRLSKSEQLQREGFQSDQRAQSDSGDHDDHASPSSVTSVRTDLVLGTLHEPACKDEHSTNQKHTNHLEDCSGCLPSKKVDDFSRNVPEVFIQSHSYSACPDLLANSTYPLMHIPSVSKAGGVPAFDQRCQGSSNLCQKIDQSNYKSFCTSLINKVGRQEEALSAISQTIVRCRTSDERRHGASLKGDIWLTFLGPDKVGKKKVAVALAELMYGSKENLICIDLSYQVGTNCPTTICNQQEVSGYDEMFRGKTIVDHIAGELGKKPWSIVFLENLDKADLPVQKSLSRAHKTGKFPDSHGREFRISNTIFVITATKARAKAFSPRTDSIKFSEERILAAQGWQMKILIQPVSEAASSNPNVNVLIASRQKSRNKQASLSSVFVSKRKLDVADDFKEHHESLGTAKRAHKTSNTFLDLNLPVDEVEANDMDNSSSHENSSTSDNTAAWVEDFFNSVDATVNFKPYDFDALADNILREISKSFHDKIGSECMLEIDVKVMEQILAAAWLLEDRGALNVWFEQVLGRSFTELREKYKLSTRTILRLVACEDVFVKEHAPGVLLPSRICLN